ncbi:site-specific integrase [Cytobacillus oceanisediminis]|uniref:hypothetical protein n=1 Tax=Cytobacillus oceanisediminis TaxID=665099 RepID=UPI0037350FF5
MLCRTDGNVVPKSTLFNAFSRILSWSASPAHLFTKAHTHAVVLLEDNEIYMQERLDHGSVQVTADVYAHISKKSKKTQKQI